MLPAIMLVQTEIDLHEWPPLRPHRLSNQVHVHLMRQAVALARVTRDARANHVFPTRVPAAISRNHVIKVQIAAIKNMPAILAGELIALENFKSDFFGDCFSLCHVMGM